MKRNASEPTNRWEFALVSIPPEGAGMVMALCVTGTPELELRFAEPFHEDYALVEAVRRLARESGVRSATIVVRDVALADTIARLAPGVHVIRETRLPALDEATAELIDMLTAAV